MPSQVDWTATAERQPADGQKVEVKTAHGVEQRATFRAVPAMYWVHPYAALEYFPYWRPLGSSDQELPFEK
jgi:hypothetical protein